MKYKRLLIAFLISLSLFAMVGCEQKEEVDEYAELAVRVQSLEQQAAFSSFSVGSTAQTNIPYLGNLEYLQYDTSFSAPSEHSDGLSYWNSDAGTLDIMTNISGTTLQVGQELYRLVVNKTGTTLTDGTVVYPSGAQGNRLTVDRADADLITTTLGVGIITHDCADNAECLMTTFGTIRGQNTSLYSVSTTLYLSTVAGEYTSTAPVAPAFVLELGEVSVSHAQQGQFEFSPPHPQAFGDVRGGTYTAFESTGFQQSVGDYVWLDYNFGTGALGTGVSAPDLVEIDSSGIFLRSFDGGVTSEQTFFSLEMNHNWAEGTYVEPHVHWMPTTTGTGVVVWYMTIGLTSPLSPTFTSQTISVTASITENSQWKSFYTEFPSVTMPLYTIGTQWDARFYRVPTGVDTYSDDAAVSTVGLHVQVDSLGSREESSK